MRGFKVMPFQVRLQLLYTDSMRVSMGKELNLI